MNSSEVFAFVRVVRELQREMCCSLNDAKATAGAMLGDGITPASVPTDAEFNHALLSLPNRRGRGRPSSGTLQKSEAVAAVAVYFESVGAGREQAVNEAKRWLNVSLSRRVAKGAVESFKANTSQDQFKPQALFAYAKFSGSSVPLPETMQKMRRRRQQGFL